MIPSLTLSERSWVFTDTAMGSWENVKKFKETFKCYILEYGQLQPVPDPPLTPQFQGQQPDQVWDLNIPEVAIILILLELFPRYYSNRHSKMNRFNSFVWLSGMLIAYYKNNNYQATVAH